MPAPVSQTSLQGPGVSTVGTQIQVGNGNSPDSFVTICNATELKIPTLAETVDLTNFGDLWRRRVPSLLDMGKIGFKIFWVMEEQTHRNSTPYGLRYLLINRLLRDWQVVYPDGNNSTDSFQGYVTMFEITGSIGKDYEGNIELSNAGAPSLC